MPWASPASGGGPAGIPAGPVPAGRAWAGSRTTAHPQAGTWAAAAAAAAPRARAEAASEGRPVTAP